MVLGAVSSLTNISWIKTDIRWAGTGNEHIEKGTGASNRPAQADLCVMSASGQDIPDAHGH